MAATTPVRRCNGPPEDNAGFTTGTPWIGVNPNHETINVEAATGDDASVLAHYRRLIGLRKQHPVIVHGDYVPYLEDDPRLFVFARNLHGVRLIVVANFSGEPTILDVAPELEIDGECLITNGKARGAISGKLTLAPWEAFAILA
jgi:oligo-1,6-glucosidase